MNTKERQDLERDVRDILRGYVSPSGGMYKGWKKDFTDKERADFGLFVTNNKIIEDEERFEVFFDILVDYIADRRLDPIFLDSYLMIHLETVIGIRVSNWGKRSKLQLEKDEYGTNDLKNVNNPFVKRVALYFYGGIKVIYINKNGEFVYKRAWDENKTTVEKSFKLESDVDRISVFDREAIEMMKKAHAEGRTPIDFFEKNILYFGVCNIIKNPKSDKKEGDELTPWTGDRWYVGETKGDWSFRHMNLTSMYGTHALQTAVALLTRGSNYVNPYESKTRSRSKNIQKCDQAFAKTPRWKTRFYLLWHPKNTQDDNVRPTCEKFFMDYLKRDIVKFGSSNTHKLNVQNEKLSSKSEWEILEKVFGKSGTMDLSLKKEVTKTIQECIQSQPKPIIIKSTTIESDNNETRKNDK